MCPILIKILGPPLDICVRPYSDIREEKIP